MPKTNEQIVNNRKVFCEGDSQNGIPGHPGIYLIIPETQKNITCPYCSRKFILKTATKISSDSQE